MSKFAHLSRLWPHLPACTAVARTGTLVTAAKQLGVDRSTVSRAVSAAEGVLGARLFDRIEGRMVLTETGRVFIAQAEAAELQVRNAAQATLEGQTSPWPAVRLAMPTNLADQLAPFVFDLLNANPELRVTVLGGYEVEDISGRDVDIAVRVLREPPSATLYAEQLCELRGRIYSACSPRLGESLPMARSEAEADAMALEMDRPRLVVRGIVEHAAFLACSGQGRMPDYLAAGDRRIEAMSERLPREGWAVWLVIPRALRSLSPYREVFEALRRFRLPTLP